MKVRRALALGGLLTVTGAWPEFARGQEAAASGVQALVLPEFVLTDARVANLQPASSFATPVSDLRFEPRVDLQTRNFGEAQGDISIRGGLFEGTGIQIGGLTVFDPQTGHYGAELPIAPAMLGHPRIRTGAEHAFTGLNATAGTIDYEWRPVRAGGSVALSVGNGNLRRGSVYLGQILRAPGVGTRGVAFDFDAAKSAADGTVRDGDHRFSRVSGRLEITGERARTQLFLGRQSKFFGWPNLYTPFGVAETEDLETTLAMLSHRWESEGVRVEGAAYHRRNVDDYEFDRHRPGLFNPYEHETRATGAFARVALPVGDWKLEARGEVAADSIESTSLTAGRFNSRTLWKIGALGRRSWDAAGSGRWEALFGATFDDTNRERSAFSPLTEVAWSHTAPGSGVRTRLYAEASGSTRVPGYTALNSPAASGLFRGNPDLGRERARNLEAGLQVSAGHWSLHAALFERRDDPMVDWTFSHGAPNARSAHLVRTDTTGLELVAAWNTSPLRVVAGYTWLSKDADYFGAAVDASFYALNFPRHRFTLAITAQLGAGFELRSDTEWRRQEPNRLRNAGGDRAVLGSLGLFWVSPGIRGLELSVVVDNLWQSDFQELPAVPAPGRQVTAGLLWRW